MTTRVLGIVLLIVAIAIAVVPVMNNCTAEGLFLTTTQGKQIDMKCYWTAQASVGVGVILAVVALLMVFSASVDALKVLSIVGAALGALAIALPTVLIGVCQMEKSCKLVTLPAMLFLGTLGIVLSAAVFFFAGRSSASDAGAA